jgi:hypothetical protein
MRVFGDAPRIRAPRTGLRRIFSGSCRSGFCYRLFKGRQLLNAHRNLFQCHTRTFDSADEPRDAPAAVTIMANDRSSPIRFAELVEDNFHFLQAHGFKCVQSEPTFVRFESGRICVNVYHGRRSFEIGLEIGPLGAGSSEISYSMSEIIRLVEPSKADGYRNYAAQTPEDIGEGVHRLAISLRRYVDAKVLDDPGLVERLTNNRTAWAHNYAKEVNLTQARGKLDAAWHVKDYAKVVEVLEPFRAYLTPTELMKLEYAKTVLS